jgi:aspartate aminotransferase-like enzyme
MLLTPGPTAVPPEVREAMAEQMPNPDIEPAFRDLYADVTDKLAEVYGTDDDVVVLGGEGILGLEAAVASVVEPGDEVLCVANGLYGEGFADFVESYGGEPTVVSADWTDTYDRDAAADALADGEFAAATVVHCETPTGALNDVGPVLDLLDDHGVLSIVDAVSSLGGTPVPADRIDICLGASQKCFSAPPGLTTASVSDDAWAAIEERDPESLYTNLLPWRDTGEEFPYTHLVNNVAALDAALDRLLDEGLQTVYERHEAVAAHCRERARELGLDVYPGPERSSPTVTALSVPGRAKDLQRRLDEDHDVVLAASYGPVADDVLRVGHMGYGAEKAKVNRAMDALAAEL